MNERMVTIFVYSQLNLNPNYVKTLSGTGGYFDRPTLVNDKQTQLLLWKPCKTTT